MVKCRLFLFTLVVLAMSMAFFAFAQDPTSPVWDPSVWAKDLLAYSVAISAAVALLREYIWKTLDGPLVRVVAVGLGAVSGAVLGALNVFDGGLLGGLLYGAGAGIATFLGVSAVRSVLGLGKAKG